MNDITRALARALGTLLHPRMLWLMVWPVAVSLAIWGILAFLFGADVLDSLLGYLNAFTVYQRVAEWSVVPIVVKSLAWILLFIMFIPLVLITATVIISIVSMPMMVNHIASRDYPALERNGGGMAGGVLNALLALFWLAVFAIVTLPLWLIPPLWLVIPIFLVGYLNQRLFRYDALAEHAKPDELKRVVADNTVSLWSLGILLAVLGHIPFVGFFLPVFGGLAFIHFCLARLVAARAVAAPVPGPLVAG
jgi:CysZ protein